MYVERDLNHSALNLINKVNVEDNSRCSVVGCMTLSSRVFETVSQYKNCAQTVSAQLREGKYTPLTHQHQGKAHAALQEVPRVTDTSPRRTRIAEGLYKARVVSRQQFENAWEIMISEFPSSEFETKEEYWKQLELPYFRFYEYTNENHETVAFIAFLELNDFTFVEHLAVSRKFQGKSLGTKIMKDFLKSTKNQVVLEVEDPNHLKDSEESHATAIRRVQFYTRLGFYSNPHCVYKQPCVNKDGGNPPFLMLMSNNSPLTEEKYKKMKKEIFDTVYANAISYDETPKTR